MFKQLIHSHKKKKKVSTIFRRMFRVFGHVYYHHFPQIIEIGQEAYLNSSFKYFFYLVQEFALIDLKDMISLKDLIEILIPGIVPPLTSSILVLRSHSEGWPQQDEQKPGLLKSIRNFPTMRSTGDKEDQAESSPVKDGAKGAALKASPTPSPGPPEEPSSESQQDREAPVAPWEEVPPGTIVIGPDAVMLGQGAFGIGM